jgi:hypothetical protein
VENMNNININSDEKEIRDRSKDLLLLQSNTVRGELVSYRKQFYKLLIFLNAGGVFLCIMGSTELWKIDKSLISVPLLSFVSSIFLVAVGQYLDLRGSAKSLKELDEKYPKVIGGELNPEELARYVEAATMSARIGPAVRLAHEVPFCFFLFGASLCLDGLVLKLGYADLFRGVGAGIAVLIGL